jgi:hypothetical protein
MNKQDKPLAELDRRSDIDNYFRYVNEDKAYYIKIAFHGPDIGVLSFFEDDKYIQQVPVPPKFEFYVDKTRISPYHSAFQFTRISNCSLTYNNQPILVVLVQQAIFKRSDANIELLNK